MGLFDAWQNKTDAAALQKKYLSDFNKGRVNKANEIAEGLMQSVVELGVKVGLTEQQTLDKLNAALARQSDKLEYDNKILGAAGEIIGELTIAAPASAMGWFGTGSKVTQVLKQGLFGGLWEGFTKPTEGDRLTEAGKAAAISAGATAALGAIGRPLEKLTNFDFKDNIKAVRDASASLGITPNLLGDFTGREITRVAESLSKTRGGGVVQKLKANVDELAKASTKVETEFTGGVKYSEQAGQNIATAIQTNYNNAAKQGGELYKKLDSIVANNNLTKIETTETTAALSKVLDEYGDLFKVLERPQLEAKFASMRGNLVKEEIKQPAGLIVDEAGRPIIPEIKGPVEFTFKDLRQAREGLTDALQAAKRQNKFGAKESIRLNEVVEALDRDIENWGANASKNESVADAWKTARDYWRGNVIPLRDADLALTMLKDPNSGELKTDISKLVSRIISNDTVGQEGAKRASAIISKVLPAEVKQDVAAATFNTARTEATDASGVFDPIKFSTFLQSRKQNLQPFVDQNLDTLLNKYSYISQQLTRSGGVIGDQPITTALRVGAGAAIGGPAGAAMAAVPVNRLAEVLSRNVFDTAPGRAIMLSAKSIDDLRPLITGGVVSQPSTASEEPQWSLPPETSEWKLPPEGYATESNLRGIADAPVFTPEVINTEIATVQKEMPNLSPVDQATARQNILDLTNKLNALAR